MNELELKAFLGSFHAKGVEKRRQSLKSFSKQDTFDDSDEMLEMRRWVSSLSLDQLLIAMEFPCHSTHQTPSVSTTYSNTNMKASNSDEDGIISQDFALIQQMVQLQAPVPTPIHPRAISYKLATKRGVNDGQNDEDRIRRERFSRPRLFQFIKRNTIYDNFTSRSRKIHPSKKKQDHYDVIARRFISPWNEHLSIGMTQEQITADDMIIRGTRIEKNYDGIPLRCTFCLENIVIEKQISTNENLSLATKDILNILRIASRGKFLSKYKGPNTKDENCSAAQHDSFAPWFHPDEWFSLSAYLVNCFETSLWERFALVKSHRDTTEVTTLTNPSNHHPIVGIMNTLSDERIERALLDSVKMALKETLQNHDSSKLTRDHILWNLLKESVHLTFNQKILFNNSVHEKLNSLKQRVKKSILSTPLIEIGTSIDVFTTCTQKHLQNALAAAAETQLLNNVNTICPPIKNNSNENTTATSNKKKRKKKKKKLKHRQSNVVKESQQEEASQIENNDTIDEDPIPPTTVDEDEKNNSMDVMQTFSIQPPVSIQRNKNTIVALMIVDDVLEKVCEKLGFVTEKGSKDAINQNLNEVDDAKYTIISHEKKASSARDNTQLIIKQKAKTRIRPPEKAVSKRKDAHYHPKQSKAEVTISQPKAISNEHNKTTNLLIDRGRQTGWPRLNDTLENFDYTSSPIIALQSNRQEKPETIAYRTDPHNQPHYQSLVASTEHFNYLHPHGSYRDIAVPSYFDASTLKASGAFDGWLGVKHLQRQNSLLADFFTDDTKDRNENLIASSTAASIASSSGDDEDEDLVDEKSHDEDSNSTSNFNDVEEAPTNSDFKLDSCTNIDSNLILEPLSKSKSPSISSTSNSTHSKQLSIQLLENIPSNSGNKPSRSSPSSGLRTPPPRSSPLLISLADLPRFRKRGTSVEQRKKFDKQPTKKNHLVSGSLPSSPIASSPNMVGSTWSPDDLPLKSSTGKKKFHLTKEMFNKGKGSFRLLRKSFLQVASSSAHDLSKFSDSGESLQNSTHHRKRKTNHGVQKLPAVSIPDADFELGTSYALSDGAFENHEGEISSQHRDNDNITTTKDGTTTISSAAPDMEDINILREERNAYRDMCLTLGAEVAKLKNLLSSERGTSMHPMMLYPTTPMKPYCFNSSYDPEFMAPFFHGTKAAMSDAGVQRHDHDSIRSEDGTDIVQGTIGGAESVGLSWIGHHSGGNNMRGTPTGTGTYVGSDSSVGQMGSLISGGFRPLNRDSLWSTPFHGLQSRLSKDIYNFLEKISIQLNKQDIKRKSAIDRLSKMVTALWPRAQIKIYGSHVSNLCLPSSDLDFVICLPAVHKNAPAAAAGVLEGRNAINETWQKLLARKLKGESWIDPRSIKLIERTVVPVIKVSTKDKKSDVLQLDISFDGPGHHGLEAVQMVTEVMQEFPMVRPLLLVLKQFLLDRGLLTAYTGGLSSYCLFLMVTRYLQEQPSSLGDCGSLLMGFLDFYGNNFDPAATGISVLRRQYFSRQNYDQVAQTQTPDQMRNVGKMQMSSKFGMRPPRVQNRSSTTLHTFHEPTTQHGLKVEQYGRPFTFDPIFVEDPLSSSNNVGRNAFRVHQIKRAFSDAHRALVASLEWDINSSDLHAGSDHPLLNCLLQNKDVFYEIDEPNFLIR